MQHARGLSTGGPESWRVSNLLGRTSILPFPSLSALVCVSRVLSTWILGVVTARTWRRRGMSSARNSKITQLFWSATSTALNSSRCARNRPSAATPPSSTIRAGTRRARSTLVAAPRTLSSPLWRLRLSDQAGESNPESGRLGSRLAESPRRS